MIALANTLEVIDVATDDDEEESLLQVTPREGLRMLDHLVCVIGICEEDRRALFFSKRKDGNPFHSI